MGAKVTNIMQTYIKYLNNFAYLYQKSRDVARNVSTLNNKRKNVIVYFCFLSIEYHTYQIYASTNGIPNETIDMVFKVNKLELLFAIVKEL